MPPGTHKINASKNGEPAALTVKVHAATAALLQQQLQEIRSRAAAGQEDLPYLDFNHDDREASARVLAFSWGGEDPVTGGIRAKVEWTGAGKRALEDKAYRRFSPSFFANADGEITGAPLNLGGLVNRAAFKTIQPIVAGAAGDANPERKSLMDPNAQLAADLAAANNRIAELMAKLDKAGHEQAIQAKDAEIAGLKTQITNLQTKLTEQNKVNAKAIVATAVASGRLAPQATEVHAKWEAQIAKDPSAAELLNQLDPVFAKAGGTIVPNANGGANAGGAASGKGADDFVTLYRAKRGEGKSKSQALDIAMAEKPEGYAAWYAANGKPGLD